MKKYIKCADTSGYDFYVDDLYDEYSGSYILTVKSKAIPDFEAEITVAEHGGNGFEITDYETYGDMSDDELDEIIDKFSEDIEDVILDYLYDNDLVYMDSNGFTHIYYK